MRGVGSRLGATRAAALCAVLAGALALAACGSSEDAATAAGDGEGGITTDLIGTFDEPVYIHGPPGADSLVFVVERSGTLRVIEDGQPLSGTFLDISDRVRSKPGGMLSVAFAPDYAESGLFYVFFTDLEGNSRVVEYGRSESDPHRASADSARTVIRIDKPADAEHNGGQLQFGPDGLLYISTGDGGGAGDPDDNAQDTGSLLGKILRIDPRADGDRPYSVPADNPFVSKPGRDEIYAYGLRNPWRFSFDRDGGALVIADVGQSTREEIDYAEPGDGLGANFGWDAFEGSRRFDSPSASPPPGGHVKPIFEYPLKDGNCAVIGGYVVRDPRLKSLQGRYLYADFCKGELRSFLPAAEGASDDRATGVTGESINTFGEDADGRIYFATLNGEEVFVLNPE